MIYIYISILCIPFINRTETIAPHLWPILETEDYSKDVETWKKQRRKEQVRNTCSCPLRTTMMLHHQWFLASNIKSQWHILLYDVLIGYLTTLWAHHIDPPHTWYMKKILSFLRLWRHQILGSKKLGVESTKDQPGFAIRNIPPCLAGGGKTH